MWKTLLIELEYKNKTYPFFLAWWTEQGVKTGFIPRLRTLYDSGLSFNGVVDPSPNRLSPFDTGGATGSGSQFAGRHST
jgi:hypothetical protein